jgi:hypothetical protein
VCKIRNIKQVQGLGLRLGKILVKIKCCTWNFASDDAEDIEI